MFRMSTHFLLLRISGALAALMLLLTACNIPTTVPIPAPTEAAAPKGAASTQAPSDNMAPGTTAVTVDVSGVAQNVTLEAVAAVAQRADGPWWEGMPQHTQLTLQGYPVANHAYKPQIFVYPVKDLPVNENAAKIAQDLQSLLQSQQAGDTLPKLPLEPSATQVLHAQVKYLDFKNGKGVRYLAQYGNGFAPINNQLLHYTYQGLTSDGKYYVAVVLPVTLSSLPADSQLSDELVKMIDDKKYPQYLADTAAMLNQQAASAFAPNLSKLDALVQSIEVK
jgi:hypothetical protein